MDTNSLDLEQCVSVCNLLEKLLRASFGPNALHNLLCAATGKLMISSSGRATLQSLHVAHPCGKLLINGALSLHQVCGDNSKSFVFIVGAVLRGLSGVLKEESNVNYKARRVELSRAFTYIKNTVLPVSVVPCLLHRASSTLMVENNREMVFEVCRHVIWTTLQGRFNQGTREFLTNLLCRLFQNQTLSIVSLVGVVQGLIDDFGYICVDSPGQAIVNSELLDGVVIQRDFLPFAAPSGTMQNVRYCLIGFTLEDPVPGDIQEVTVNIKTSENLRNSLSWKGRYLKPIVDRLSQMTVNFLLFTDTISDMAAYLFKQFNINVIHAVPVEDLDRLARMSTVDIIYDPRDIFDDKCKVVGSCDAVRTVMCGGRRFVHMEGLHGHCQQRLQTLPARSRQEIPPCCTVLLCAPTPGMCDQVGSAMLCSMKAILLAVNPRQFIDMSSIDAKITNDSLSKTSVGSLPPTQRAGNQSLTVPGGGAVELFIHKLLLSASVVNRQVAAVALACSVLAEAVLIVPLKLIENSYAPDILKMSTAQLLQMVNSGGSYRHQAVSLVESNKQLGTEQSEHDLTGDNEMIPESNDRVPVTSVCYRSTRSCEVNEYSGGNAAFIGVDGRGGRSELIDPTILEPLASKVRMLYAVIELVEQILRLDCIVSVRKLADNSSPDTDCDM